MIEAGDIWKFVAVLVSGLSAGGLTVWRIMAGYNVVNLSLAIDAKRTPIASSEKHNLVTTIELKKGKAGSLVLERLEVSVTYPDQEAPVSHRFDTYLRDLGRHLNITPDEETQFAAHFQVPSNAICQIEVTVSGVSIRPTLAGMRLLPVAPSRWKASAISVPNSE